MSPVGPLPQEWQHYGLEVEREANGVPHFQHLGMRQSRYELPDLAFRYCLDMITIHRAVLRHAIGFGK